MAKHWTVESSEQIVETLPTVYREMREVMELNKRTAALRAGLSPQTIGYLEEQHRSPLLLSFARMAFGLCMRPSELLAAVEERVGLERLFEDPPADGN